MKDNNIGFIFSCGHTAIGGNKLPKTAYYSLDGICEKCHKMSNEKQYLGEGVYVDIENSMIRLTTAVVGLTTDDEFVKLNEIRLNPYVLEEFLKYIGKTKDFKNTDFKNPVHLKQKEKHNRFTDNYNGTVIDNITKLVWLKDANAFGSKTWKQARVVVTNLSSGSRVLTDDSEFGDWRLPEIWEMQELVNLFTKNNEFIEDSIFFNLQTLYYWSNTTHMKNKELAWYMLPKNGDILFGSKNNKYHVLPVREARQDELEFMI